MKKKLLYLSIIVACLVVTVTSCTKELENWYSATSNYDGRFVVSVVCQENSAKSAIIEDGNEIYIYNTAANTANEIWIDDVFGAVPLKSKFQLDGTSGNFSGKETVDNVKSKLYIFNEDEGEYVEFVATNKSDFPVATAVGQECNGIQEYVRATLTEGKIVPGGATSVGGNASDGILLKFTLSTDNIKFVSFEIPEDDWEESDVPEYGWTVKAGSNSPDASKYEHWTLEGYRYTGYPEDI